MPNIGPLELILILIVALLVIGPGKLPEVGAALGKSIREFRKATTEVQDSVRMDFTAPPAQPAQPAPPAPAYPVATAAPAVAVAPPAAVSPAAEPPAGTPTSTNPT